VQGKHEEAEEKSKWWCPFPLKGEILEKPTQRDFKREINIIQYFKIRRNSNPAMMERFI